MKNHCLFDVHEHICLHLNPNAVSTAITTKSAHISWYCAKLFPRLQMQPMIGALRRVELINVTLLTDMDFLFFNKLELFDLYIYS